MTMIIVKGVPLIIHYRTLLLRYPCACIRRDDPVQIERCSIKVLDCAWKCWQAEHEGNRMMMEHRHSRQAEAAAGEELTHHKAGLVVVLTGLVEDE